MDKDNDTNDKFYGKVAFLSINKWLILGLKAEKHVKKKQIEDWVLGSHPLDNGHMTH